MVDHKMYAPKTIDMWGLVFNAVVTGVFSVWNMTGNLGFGYTMSLFAVVSTMYLIFACSLAEISSSLPIAGGAYGLARFSLGFFPGFAVAAFEAMEYVVNVSTCVVTFAQTLSTIWPDIFTTQEQQYAIYFAFYAFGYLFYALLPGRPFFIFNLLQALICVGLLLTYVFGSIPYTKWSENATNETPIFADIKFGEWMTGLVPLTAIFFGIESALMLNDHAKDPRETVPRAFMWLWATLAGCALMVIPVAYAVPPGQQFLSNTTSPIIYGFGAMLGSDNYSYYDIFFLPTAFGSTFALMFTYEKLLYSVAESKLLPDCFTWKNRFGAPYIANLGGHIVGLCLCFIGGISPSMAVYIYNVMVVFACLAYLAQFYGYILLRQKYFDDLDRMPEFKRKFKSPFGVEGAYFAMALCVLITISAIFYQGTTSLMIGTIFVYLFLLALYYLLYAKKRQTFSQNENEILYVLHLIKFKRNNNKGKSIRKISTETSGKPRDESLSPIDYFLRYGELPRFGKAADKLSQMLSPKEMGSYSSTAINEDNKTFKFLKKDSNKRLLKIANETQFQYLDFGSIFTFFQKLLDEGDSQGALQKKGAELKKAVDLHYIPFAVRISLLFLVAMIIAISGCEYALVNSNVVLNNGFINVQNLLVSATSILFFSQEKVAAYKFQHTPLEIQDWDEAVIKDQLYSYLYQLTEYQSIVISSPSFYADISQSELFFIAGACLRTVETCIPTSNPYYMRVRGALDDLLAQYSEEAGLLAIDAQPDWDSTRLNFISQVAPNDINDGLDSSRNIFITSMTKYTSLTITLEILKIIGFSILIKIVQNQGISTYTQRLAVEVSRASLLVSSIPTAFFGSELEEHDYEIE